MQLRTIAPEAYARLVMPQTAPLWGGGDLDAYVARWLGIARSRFGRKHYRTVGLYENRTLLASLKEYDRTILDGSRRLRAVGLGAVFTPEALRGRGYATAMIAAVLDRARNEGYDVAYLFSDIRPQFYAAIGFRKLPSREIVLRADALPSKRLAVVPLIEKDWGAVRRCFDLASRGHVRFERTPLVWEWVRARLDLQLERSGGQPFHLTVRHGRGIGAYVLGGRIPHRDAYYLSEFGFADDLAASVVPGLLRAAAGDLRRIVGWLPPHGARELLPRGNIRARRGSVLMAAPLSSGGTRLVSHATQSSAADFCWEAEHV
ncbi:MAG TPA: GNAT family N-acetyltransferase [Candidatus Baltobacteraceae bacterium]